MADVTISPTEAGPCLSTPRPTVASPGVWRLAVGVGTRPSTEKVEGRGRAVPTTTACRSEQEPCVILGLKCRFCLQTGVFQSKRLPPPLRTTTTTATPSTAATTSTTTTTTTTTTTAFPATVSPLWVADVKGRSHSLQEICDIKKSGGRERGRRFPLFPGTQRGGRGCKQDSLFPKPQCSRGGGKKLPEFKVESVSRSLVLAPPFFSSLEKKQRLREVEREAEMARMRGLPFPTLSLFKHFPF